VAKKKKATKKVAQKKRPRRKGKFVDPTKIKVEDFLVALDGTGGIRQEIAMKLGVPRSVVDFCLNREGPDWETVKQRYQEECDAVADSAHTTMKWMIEQRVDLALAERASRWYLEKKMADFAPQQAVVVESKSVVDLEKLNLPLKIRKAILAAILKVERNGTGVH